MKKTMFDELVTSVKQAGEIRRGEKPASRTFTFLPEDIKEVRAQLGLTQADFALLIGVSVATLRNWEQGRRKPDGPAMALLRVASKNPQLVAQALST
jgi:putative transcriptional regulator